MLSIAKPPKSPPPMRSVLTGCCFCTSINVTEPWFPTNPNVLLTAMLSGMSSPPKPIILVAYDTGMRLREILGLRWSQVNLQLGVIKLSAEDTKTEEPRTVVLTSRVQEALEAQPRQIKSDWVFTNPETEEAWKDIRKMFHRALQGGEAHGCLVP